MSTIVPFKRSKTKAKTKRKLAAQGKSLCKTGFHKWQIDQQKKFAVKRGKLVTTRRCQRCGISKTTLE
ncbi:MAG: hypothetical protein O7G86_17875 [Gammaproteobacteria bacterium]|nr:hypothetical protein [Gammaproteobacteria bacterium]MCZ6855785.1 hypothetical protein [Gammaproteobacteria bacterium]